MGRPITEGDQGGSLKVVTNSGDLDGTDLYYYGVAAGVRAGRSVAAGLRPGRVVQVRDGSENVMRQIAHAERDRGGSVKDFGDGDGKVTEDEWDTDEDGQLDSDDNCWGSGPSGVCRLVDFDFDGDVDATDATRLAELDSTTTYRQPGQAYGGIGNTRAHQGLIYDAEIGSYNNRKRQYAASLKRFIQRDPLALAAYGSRGLQDGLNLYGCVRDNPFRFTDASGLETELGIHIKQTPYCICGRKGHRWFRFADGSTADFPSGFIQDVPCEDNPDYYEFEWNVCVDDDTDEAEFTQCLKDKMAEFDKNCVDKYGGSGYHYRDCTCRKAVDWALSQCDGRKCHKRDHPGALARFCLSKCGRGKDDL